MIKVKNIVLVLVLSLSLMLFVSCTNKELNVSLNSEFNLNQGQTALISSEDLQVKFIEIIADSRCPSDVTCIWAGVASAKISITYKDESYTLVLNQPGLSDNTTEIFMDYSIAYDIQPYPDTSKNVEFKDYTLKLSFSK